MSAWAAAIVCVAGSSAPVESATSEGVRARLASPFHQDLYARTYKSLLSRVDTSGYFRESLTGAYAGMFPRTVGGLVSLLLETGELAKCEALVGYALRATRDSGMERVPHVVGPPTHEREVVAGSSPACQPRHTIALYRLDQPKRFGGAQEFVGPEEPVRAVELWLAGEKCSGTLRLEIAPDLTGPALATVERDASDLRPLGSWVRFAFASPPALKRGARHVARVHFNGKGRPTWWGLADAAKRPLGAGHGRDTKIKPGWLDNPGHVTAFALDTGKLRHVEQERVPVLDAADQIDGQAHVLVAWARLALRRGPTPFEDRTYGQVAELMDRSTSWQYIKAYHPLLPRIDADQLGLVRNVCFEHSREGRFWDTYDILTQAFVAAAMEEMIRVARGRGDSARVERWEGRLRSLATAVRWHMTRELDGKTVYLEMRLPDGGAGVPFEGLGWVNLGPVAAGWKGVDREVLRNTIAAYRKRGLFRWQGKVALCTDWWPGKPPGKVVIGKGVGWEMVYSLGEGEWDRIGQWLDFVEAVNSAPLYMEAAWLKPDGTWQLNDPGNGEQCAWWCWAMAKVRRAVGLPAAPER